MASRVRRRPSAGTSSGPPTTSPGREPDAVADGAVRRESAIAAWLPIIYGCDKTCTYCIVPFSRGPERSRPFDDVVEEARGARRRRLPRGHAARPERQLVRPRPAGRAAVQRRRHRPLGGPPARPPRPARPRGADPGDRRHPDGRRRARDLAPALRDLPPVGPQRPPDRGDGRVPIGLRAPPPAGPVRRRRGAQADGPPVHDRALPRAAGARSARPFPGSRSRPTSSSGSAARPRRSSRRRCGSSRPSATTPSSPRRTRSGRGRPRPTSPTTSRRTSSAAA